ncbi:uncharacterized protein Nmag_0131 [Natrialba magadii ATCC 43099]|uniref:Uncharacterized protein n=1 Tax=Natrialba magadii (strain ATCC 43099 / DSM 3394 / CCM 3739 / CIP 104546 / IAM 13178 / JCM 8861 / NBRC 102185 / NCIMB 2190 / MS3) TaxID=547559 RepID=D3SWD6_NATMM|nr:uncharacterized protein Nmag_0131 [Natrialba magadii ATCC 43099]ELY33783.1 hypothetical protein C500_01118 [Natrialba magadii ATCC 43099]
MLFGSKRGQTESYRERRALETNYRAFTGPQQIASEGTLEKLEVRGWTYATGDQLAENEV